MNEEPAMPTEEEAIHHLCDAVHFCVSHVYAWAVEDGAHEVAMDALKHSLALSDARTILARAARTQPTPKVHGSL